MCSDLSGHFEDLSSSEDSDSAPPRIRSSRNRAKGISIHDGPQAIAKFRVGGTSKLCGTVSCKTSGLQPVSVLSHTLNTTFVLVMKLNCIKKKIKKKAVSKGSHRSLESLKLKYKK